jgi:tRNA threonylcarbamoyladenosine biosynthesis protein TsaE
MKQDFTQNLADEAATLHAATQFAPTLKAGMVIYLHGDLGAGKTTFVRGVLHALGHQGKVKSPTYNLVEPYVVDGLNIYHFDLYRFQDEEEWEAAGFRDYFNVDSICFVEWPEKAATVLPQADVEIYLTIQGHQRTLRVITM